jgi:hypothetical protein
MRIRLLMPAPALLAFGLALPALGHAVPASGTKPVRGAVAVDHRYDPSGDYFVEGYVQTVRIRRAGRIVASGRLPAKGDLRFRLAPGTYRLSSSTRVCAGNCGQLEGPVNRCGRTIDVVALRTVRLRVTVSASAPCRISMRAAPSAAPDPALSGQPTAPASSALEAR